MNKDQIAKINSDLQRLSEQRASELRLLMESLADKSRDELIAEIDHLRSLIVEADFVQRARFTEWGIMDSIDNRGNPYPSQWAADLVRRAQETHGHSPSLERWRG